MPCRYERRPPRLEDILDATGKIEKYTTSGRQHFDDDELVRVSILHHLEIIGEACRGLSEAFHAEHPDEMWSDAISFRKVLAHHYFGIDDEAVWVWSNLTCRR